MRLHRKQSVAKLSCLLFCTVVCSQSQSKPSIVTNVAPPPSPRFPASWYPPDNDVTYTTTPQANSPYTATLVTTTRYLDPSTKQIKVFSQSTFQARDVAGRKRDETEMPRPDGHGGIIMAHEVTVSDPVSHCRFVWMEPWVAPGNPTAGVSCMPRTLHYNSQNPWVDATVTKPTETHSLNTVVRSEPLGRRMFGDLEAVGVQNIKTQTNPQTGSIQKFVTQMWYSPQLDELLELKGIPNQTPGQNEDQVSEIPDFALTNIHRVEPDPALFYPPASYTIQPGH